MYIIPNNFISTDLPAKPRKSIKVTVSAEGFEPIVLEVSKLVTLDIPRHLVTVEEMKDGSLRLTAQRNLIVSSSVEIMSDVITKPRNLTPAEARWIAIMVREPDLDETEGLRRAGFSESVAAHAYLGRVITPQMVEYVASLRARAVPRIRNRNTGVLYGGVSVVDELAKLLESANMKIVFGLRQQGHVPTVEFMMAMGSTWYEIGRAIRWNEAAAQAWYERFEAHHEH